VEIWKYRKNTVYTPYIHRIYIWFWPTLIICSGLVKRYRLESMQSDILDANLDREAFPVTVVAEADGLGR